MGFSAMGDDSEVSSSSSHKFLSTARLNNQNSIMLSNVVISDISGRGSTGSECLTDELDLWDLDLQNVYNNNNNNNSIGNHHQILNMNVVTKRREVRNTASMVSSFSDSCSSGILPQKTHTFVVLI